MSNRTEPVDVRVVAEDEIPQVVALWEEAGWGRVSMDHWVARHRNGPHGPSTVVVAADEDGTLVGQLTMLRTGLNVRGTTVPAARLFGLFVAPRFRRSAGYLPTRSHPVRRLISTAIRVAADEGVQTVFALPDKRVLTAATLAVPSARAARFPFWSVPIDRVPDLPAGHDVVPVVTEDDVDAVWERCRPSLVCPVRDGRTLAWKDLFAHLRVEGIRRGGELVAVVASRRHGDRQWLVEDLLAVDDLAARAAVGSVVRAAVQESEVQELRKVGALVTPRLEPALAASGFVPDDFTFNLLVLPLHSGSPAADVDPAQWDLTPND